jgi:Tfp pilus assembly protein FimV
MAAVAQLSPAPGRRLVVVRSAPAPRPEARRVPAATYRRRRAVALAAATTVVLALSMAFHGLGGAGGGGAPATTARAGSPGAVYVVQAGDTFWDIARMLRPDGDPRPLVARLVAAHGSAVLRVGERIPLPTAA